MQQEGTSSEVAFHKANQLLGQGKFKEACDELATARDEAKRAGDLPISAFYSSVLGSFLASKHHDEPALQSYLDAERSDPSELTHQMRTARFLLNASVRDLEGAFKRIETIAKRSDNQELRDDAADCLATLIDRVATEQADVARRAETLLEMLRR